MSCASIGLVGSMSSGYVKVKVRAWRGFVVVGDFLRSSGRSGEGRREGKVERF